MIHAPHRVPPFKHGTAKIGALPANYANGMFIPQVILDWMEVPNELRDEYEGGLVYV